MKSNWAAPMVATKTVSREAERSLRIIRYSKSAPKAIEEIRAIARDGQ